MKRRIGIFIIAIFIIFNQLVFYPLSKTVIPKGYSNFYDLYGGLPLYQDIYKELLTPEITSEILNYYGQYYNYDLNKIDILDVYNRSVGDGNTVDEITVEVHTFDKDKNITSIDYLIFKIENGEIRLLNFKHIKNFNGNEE